MREYKIINPTDLEKNEIYLNKIFNSLNERILALTNLKGMVKVEFYLNLNDSRIYSRSKEGEKDNYEVIFPISLYRDLEAFYTHIFNECNSLFFSSIMEGQQWNENDKNVLRNLMLQYSISLYLFHELGHIYNGHLKYFDQNKVISDDMFMIFEMNADDFASTQMVTTYAHPENVKILNKKLENHLTLGNVGLIIFSSIIIAISMTSLGKKGYKEDKRHLPLRIRALQILENYMGTFDFFNYIKNKFIHEQFSKYKDNLLDLAIKDENLVNDYLNKVTLTDNYSINNNLEFLTPDNCNLYFELEDEYKRSIYSTLKDYSYIKDFIHFI